MGACRMSQMLSPRLWDNIQNRKPVFRGGSQASTPSRSLVVLASYLASFPTSSFSLLAVCKNGGGILSPFYHVNDVSVYLGRQRGEESSIERIPFVCMFFVLN